MANWCTNYITFTGEKERIAKLKLEIESLVVRYDGNEGLIPDGFIEPIETIDFIHDLELTDIDEQELTIQYRTKWEISQNVLRHLAVKYNIEFVGTSLEEQNRTDTCCFIFGALDGNDEIVIVARTLAACGLDVGYMVENRSYFTDTFLDDTATALGKTMFAAFKEAVEDAQFQNGEMSH